VQSIPPDLAAVLADSPIHPELEALPLRACLPTAAALTIAALDLAALAATEPDEPDWLSTLRLPAGISGFVHRVGSGGALHLPAAFRPRALSLARGALDQRCTNRPRLTPGVVRLLSPGNAVTFADLTGAGALAVEVTA
jgi:hypothetical protein